MHACIHLGQVSRPPSQLSRFPRTSILQPSSPTTSRENSSPPFSSIARSPFSLNCARALFASQRPASRRLHQAPESDHPSFAGSPPASPPLTATPAPLGRLSFCFCFCFFHPDPSPFGARREVADCYCGSLFVFRKPRFSSPTFPRFALPATSVSISNRSTQPETPLIEATTFAQNACS